MYLKTRDIQSEFNLRFHTSVWESNLSCFTDYTKHTSAGALIHRQQTYWLDFYTDKTEQHLQFTQTYCHVLTLDETSSVAYNSGET